MKLITKIAHLLRKNRTKEQKLRFDPKQTKFMQWRLSRDAMGAKMEVFTLYAM